MSRFTYSSSQDNCVRSAFITAMLCSLGGYWGLHELYIGRIGAYLAHHAALAVAFTISEVAQSFIPLSVYVAIIALESFTIIRGHAVLSKKVEFSAPSTFAWIISHITAAIALTCSLCIAFVPFEA